MNDIIRAAKPLFVSMQNNLEKLFESFDAKFLTVELMGADDFPVVTIRNGFLANGGLIVYLEPANLQLRIDGDDSPFGTWPIDASESSLVWVLDGLARNIESIIEETFEPSEEFPSETHLTWLRGRISVLMKIHSILMAIEFGELNKWFGSEAQQQHSALAELLPYRAEKLWELDSYGIEAHLLDWQVKNWDWLRGKYAEAGFEKGYSVSAGDMGARAGRAMADEFINELKKKGIVP